ncbi:MAG: site-specific integrase [Candidatus Zixiibacteriota bacterium]|nr:MAG: site-specific integrase [candidate division Zixibacteria bacterium]
MSPKTAVNILVPLKEMFKHAVQWGYIRHDPTLAVKRPRVEQEEMDFLTPEEVTLFLQNVKSQYYAFFLTAVLTGMRRGELLALKWGDMDWHSSQICVRRSLYEGQFVSPKSANSTRRIIMSPTLKRYLEDHRLLSSQTELDLVFCTDQGQPLEPDNLVKREFHPALERGGLRRIRFHDLRHTFASLLIANGEDIKFIQNQLGHASATTTLDRYGHLFPGMQKEAAERLDETVFGNSVSKMLANTPERGLPPIKKPSEVISPQRVNW